MALAPRLEVTNVGYLPMILAPAHEIDTLHTVVVYCEYINGYLGFENIVLTVDEALFCKLMELKWSLPKYSKIPHLGGLHTILNFLRVIGQHMKIQ